MLLSMVLVGLADAFLDYSNPIKTYKLLL
ncbi:UNVERIFIED_CONTAM: hypothetical protein GTU68_026184 [Idotea baltica]|nr:hypothetical protein [Idotea baltica]